MEDTICAISTAPGIGAISIIRVSGIDAVKIVSSIFHGKDLNKAKTNTINYGFIYDNSEKIDEVLVSVLLSPKTYTMEDIVEINSHGGINTNKRILELLLEKGCRLAEPGEFTKRAFLNGRIDLIEAESVNDLINAKTNNARKIALNNMSGVITNHIKEIREQLIKVMANIEVNIDYPEYNDIKIITKYDLLPMLNETKIKLSKLLKDSDNAKIINNGINIAIVGKPNVGKSSILNKLLDEDKAIVTDVAGTTRDIVEGSMSINGFLINFIDTAGIRETSDIVEKIGVEKSKEIINNADLIILVLNNNEKISKEDKELIDIIPENKRIIFINKNDLISNLHYNGEFITGNTIEDNGLATLKEEIIKKCSLNEINVNDLTYLTNVREIDLLKKAYKSLDSSINGLNNNIPVDMALIDITNCYNFLGEIIGENYTENLLNTIFSNFCVGK